MAQKRPAQLAPLHAAPIVRDPYELDAPVLYLHGDGSRSRIYGVLHQLLHHACGTLHHLPGGNFVYCLRVQNMYLCHT